MPSPAFMIVEDGTAKVNSNAYWDVDSIVSYLTSKGVLDIQNYNEDQIARGAISSTFYIEKRFKRRYRGLRQSVAQALGWPRIGAFDDDAFTIFGVPYQVQFATAEYAIRACRVGVLAPDPLRNAPVQDMSIPVTGLVPGTNKFSATANFNAADTITIGLRTYAFVSSAPSAEGQVLVGGTLAASLVNLLNCISNSADIATGLFTASINFANGDTVQIGTQTYTFVTALNPEIVTNQTPQVLIGVNLAASLINWANCANSAGTQSETYYALTRDPAITGTVTGTTFLATANSNINLKNFGNPNPASVQLSSRTNAGTWAYNKLILSGGNGTNFYATDADPNVTATITPTSISVQSTLGNANSVGTVYSPSGAPAGAWATATITGFSNNPVTPDLILGPMRQKIEKVGPLEVSTSYDGLTQTAALLAMTTRASQSGIVNDFNIPEYPEADLWIEQIVRNPATGTRLIRGS